MANLEIHGTSYFALLNTLNGKDRCKIGNNTWAEYNSEARSIDIRLHQTVVVRVFHDDIVSINSGGYQSTTTKERINQFLPRRYALVQRNYEWFIADRFDNWSTTPFYDHMRFSH